MKPHRPAGEAAASDTRLARRYRSLLLAIALPLFALIAILALMQYRQQREAHLRVLAETTASGTLALENLAKATADYVADLRSYMETELGRPNPGTAGRLQAYYGPRTMGHGVDGYNLDGLPSELRDRTGQIWGDAAAHDSGAVRDLLRIGEDFFSRANTVHRLEPFLRWSYFMSAGRDIVYTFPWLPSREVLDGTGFPGQRAMMQAWYENTIYRLALPAENPESRPYWSPAYLGEGESGALISYAAPLTVYGELRGIVGTVLNLPTLTDVLRQPAGSKARMWLIDRNGVLLADTSGMPEKVLMTLRMRLPAGVTAEDVERALESGGSPTEADGHQLIARPVGHTPWTLVTLASEAEIRALLLPRFLPYLIISAALAGAFLTALLALRREFIQPALALVQYIQRISRSETEAEPAVPRLWQPWVELVTRTFSGYREAARRQRESETLKAAVVDHALAAIITTDGDGVIIEYNPAAETIFGVDRENALGRPVSDIIIPERNREAHRQGMARLRAGGAPRIIGHRVELRALRGDGSEFPVEMVLSRSDVGGKVFYTAFLMDISDKAAREEELARQRERLRQGEKLSAMGMLLAGVAHELNNPLAILIGRAGLLESKCHDESLRGDVEKIQTAAKRCGNIVRTFLGMARQRPMEKRPVQINDLVSGALDMLGYSLRNHGIKTVTALDPQLPEILADGDQIGQIVLNLLVNAQQALAGCGDNRQIRVGSGRDEEAGLLWLRIVDTGPGVPPDAAPRVFDPFFTTKPEGAGTGMGLSFSRSVAREHGGDLVLEAGGAGACFLLTLPLRTRGDADAAAEPETPPSQQGHGARILVVDDEKEILDLVREILGSAGYPIAAAESGAEALALLAGERFDAVISDLRMPGLDGPALRREVALHHPELEQRFIFLTGDTLSSNAAHYLAETGCPYLEKPFAPAELLGQLKQVLDR